MKYYITYFLFFTYYIVPSQYNLILNPSFENHSDEYDGRCGGSPTTDYKDLVEYWNNIDYWEIPDRRKGCWWNTNGPGSPDVICDDHYARTGKNGSRLGSEEFIVQKFQSPLKANHNYYFEFYYKSDSKFSKNSIGAFISDEIPVQCIGILFVSPNAYLNGEKNHPATFVSNINHKDFEWTKASGYFTTNSKNNNQWITFGSFYHEKYEVGTKLIDDIKIIDVGPNYCPKEWLFDNMTFNQGTETYQASERIVIGRGADPQVIPGEVILKAGSTLKLRAYKSIELIEGFTAEEGSRLDTDTNVTCEENPCTKPQFINEDIVVCNNETNLNVLSNPQDVKGSWVVKWSPAEYVDNPHILNPKFIKPSGIGVIDMEVEITTICSNFKKKIPISYTDRNLNEVNYNLLNYYQDKADMRFDVEVFEPSYVTISIEEVGYSKKTLVNPINGVNKLNWKSPNELLNTCGIYTVKITVSNYCSNQSKEETFTWNRNPNSTGNMILENVFNIVNIPSNAPNNSLNIKGLGIDFYEIEIYDRFGIRRYKNKGLILSRTAPVYTSTSDVNSSSYLPPDTYFYVLKLGNCRGAEGNFNGYFGLYNYKAGEAPEEIENLDSLEFTFNAVEISDTQLKNNAFVKDEYSNATITIFPNPVISNLTVKSNADTKGTIYIYDNIGKLLFTSEFAGTEKEINMDNFNKGIYHLNFINFKGIEQRFKFIKQ